MKNVCEECGREFEVTEYNEHAPYAMCDSCYEEYLLRQTEE